MSSAHAGANQRITLRDVSPAVVRVIDVPETSTLPESDDVEVVRRSRAWFEPEGFDDILAGVTVAVVSTSGPVASAELAAALAGDPARPSGVWQLLGEGLAAALSQRIGGAMQAAVDCAAALRERGWVGDSELADELDALAGVGPTPMLRPLAVDLEQLSDILEGDPMTTGGALDLRTGEVWPRSTIDYVVEGGDDIDAPDFEDDERFLWVHGGGSRDGYQDMVLFLDTVDDEDRADRLEIALQGRGAFRRFKDVLARWPGELERWYQFAGERQRGRARAWLAGAGYRVARD